MRLAFARHPLTLLLSLCTFVAACSSGGGGEQLPVNVINLGDGGGSLGCIQAAFPEEQPDVSVLRPPIFITDAQNGQATVDPGDPVEAEITVNGATRQALVELKDAWADIPAIASQELDTPGNQTLEVIFFTQANQRPSRFYMRITLCGFDCDERKTIFDINPDVNANYERTVIEDREVVQVDRTCIDLIPRGTVVIQ